MARLSTEARRAIFLDDGRKVFAEAPYDVVSVDDLARAAGVSKGLLYHYFPDKRAYYQEVLRQYALDVLACTEPSPCCS